MAWRLEQQKQQSQNSDTCKMHMSILMMRFHHQSSPYTLRYKGWFPKADQNFLKLLTSRFIWSLKEHISAVTNKNDSFQLKLLIPEQVQWQRLYKSLYKIWSCIIPSVSYTNKQIYFIFEKHHNKKKGNPQHISKNFLQQLAPCSYTTSGRYSYCKFEGSS